MANIKGSNLTAEVKQITPQVAKQLLATCRRNRRLSKGHILRLSQAIERGEWTIAQPILLNCDRTLLDGQHRLHAVMRAGRPVDFLVISGFDRDSTFCKIDDTRRRSLEAWFELENEPCPRVLARTVVMVMRDLAGRVPTGSGGDFHVTPIEGVEFLADHPEVRDAVVSAPATVSRYAPRAMLSFCYWKFAQKNRADARSFLIDLITGDKEAEGDPIYMLRERLKANHYAKAKLYPLEMLALIYKAWNAMRRGEKIKQLKWSSVGPKAESLPEVV